nr:putative ribonuclease H-like domain-containing protein [Tanacetum cinerariifolium]
ENQSNPTTGFQDTEKAREKGIQTYVLFPVLSDGSTNPKNNKDAHTGGNEHNDDIQKSVSPDIHSSSCGDQAKEQGDKSVNKDKGKSPVVTITGFKDLNEEFAECINNSSSGPAWLFDIDSLTQTMNYHPVLAENQSNTHAGFQDTEKAGEVGTQTYVLFPVLSDGFTNPKNNNKDALVDGKEHDDDIQKSMSLDIHSSSCGGQTRKQGDKTENKDKGKSPVVTITGFRDLNEEFEECINNSSNGVNAAGSLVFLAGLNFTNSTNDFSVAGPSNAVMPNLEDLSHNADNDPSWIEAMQEELLQFKMQKVWIFVDLPYGKRPIGIDYEEVFAPVARIKAIRLFLAYASLMGFPVYQMDVKSAFLYGTIEEEVYVCQPPGFENPEYPDKVYKVVKALYGLHQAPRAWYETLATYLLENGFQRGTIDQTLFIKKRQKDILLVQIYIDDIIFGATNKALCQSF